MPTLWWFGGPISLRSFGFLERNQLPQQGSRKAGLLPVSSYSFWITGPLAPPRAAFCSEQPGAWALGQ